MLAPRFAAVLAVVGILCLGGSALLGATRMADWATDAAQAFLALAIVVFLGYFVAGVISDLRKV